MRVPKDEYTAGGIVLGKHGAIAMVRHMQAVSPLWFFPKGHTEAGEDDETAARREIFEETGLAYLEYLDDLGSYSRHSINPDGTNNEDIVKHVHMYLFAAKDDAILAPSFEIGEAAWIPFREVPEKIENVKDKVWFASVHERVRQAIQRD